MLQGLVTSHSKSPFKNRLNLQLFVVNTDIATPEYMSRLEGVVDDVNTLAGRCAARIFWDPNAPARVSKNSLYGYDMSDMVLNYMNQVGLSNNLGQALA
jgi:hypothetical protein